MVKSLSFIKAHVGFQCQSPTFCLCDLGQINHSDCWPLPLQAQPGCTWAMEGTERAGSKGPTALSTADAGQVLSGKAHWSLVWTLGAPGGHSGHCRPILNCPAFQARKRLKNSRAGQGSGDSTPGQRLARAFILRRTHRLRRNWGGSLSSSCFLTPLLQAHNPSSC